MKKFLMMMSLALTVVCFVSCSSDESQEVPMGQVASPETDDWQVLRDSIQALNMRTFGPAYQQDFTRVSWISKAAKWLLGKLRADAEAAAGNLLVNQDVNSAVVSGAISSVTAVVKDISKAVFGARGRKASACPYPFLNYPLNDLVLGGTTTLDSIGYYHNKAIWDFYHNNSQNFTLPYVCTHDFREDVCTCVENTKNYSSGAFTNVYINDSTIMEVMDTVQARIIGGLPVINAFAEHPSMSIQDRIDMQNTAEMINTYCLTILSAEEGFDAEKYTMGYLKASMNTLSSQKRRDMFKAGILVAYASSKLWRYIEMEEE